ncbi:hypothetical protein GGS21DRAFT_434096 [Xylaria nigripes]|nr:hypothetical protein GGS21DRAFT_434096 [Xylaria nigripes]
MVLVRDGWTALYSFWTWCLGTAWFSDGRILVVRGNRKWRYQWVGWMLVSDIEHRLHFSDLVVHIMPVVRLKEVKTCEHHTGARHFTEWIDLRIRSGLTGLINAIGSDFQHLQFMSGYLQYPWSLGE